MTCIGSGAELVLVAACFIDGVLDSKIRDGVFPATLGSGYEWSRLGEDGSNVLSEVVDGDPGSTFTAI